MALIFFIIGTTSGIFTFLIISIASAVIFVFVLFSVFATNASRAKREPPPTTVPNEAVVTQALKLDNNQEVSDTPIENTPLTEVKSTETYVRPDKISCVVCGTPLLASDAFCYECGTKTN